MIKSLAISGLLALSVTPPVWSKGDNALPPSPVWEEEMMLIALDPSMDEELRRHNEEMKRHSEQMKRHSEQMKRRSEEMKKAMESLGKF